MQSELAGANEALEKAYQERDALLQEVNELKSELEKLKSSKSTRTKKSKSVHEESQGPTAEQSIEL